nr:DUF2252 family protein [Phytoactinopolyspora alkaliphila]
MRAQEAVRGPELLPLRYARMAFSPWTYLRGAAVMAADLASAPHSSLTVQMCGQALAKLHAQSGDPEAIAGYIGKGAAFADGVLRYARAHAKQTCAITPIYAPQSRTRRSRLQNEDGRTCTTVVG